MGISKIYKELQNKADKLSRTNLDILVVGESGTGRDWFVNYIAGDSKIEKIQSLTFESDIRFLQHEKKGINIYIANLEKLDNQSQNFLYRILEKREFLMDSVNYSIRRIFLSAEPSLERKVRDNEFREDFYRKITAIQLKIPPLRERREDIPIYVDLFLEELSKKHKKKIPTFGEGFWELLSNHPWYGNLSELKRFLESMLLFHKGRTFEVKQAIKILSENKNTSDLQIKIGITLEEYEKEIIRMNLISNSWNRKKTAEVLGISERNLYRKITAFQLEK